MKPTLLTYISTSISILGCFPSNFASDFTTSTSLRTQPSPLDRGLPRSHFPAGSLFIIDFCFLPFRSFELDFLCDIKASKTVPKWFILHFASIYCLIVLARPKIILLGIFLSKIYNLIFSVLPKSQVSESYIVHTSGRINVVYIWT